MEEKNTGPKKRDIAFWDLFEGIDPEHVETGTPIEVPNTLYRELLDCTMERSYLDFIGDREKFPAPPPRSRPKSPG